MYNKSLFSFLLKEKMATQIKMLLLLILYIACTCTRIASQTTSPTTNTTIFSFTETSVEQFRFKLRNAIDKEYLLGNVQIRFSEYPGNDDFPVFRLEVTERARHLRLREVFPAYQFVLVDFTGGYFSQELVLNPVNSSDPRPSYHQCILSSSPQQLVAEFRNNNDPIVWTDIVQCLDHVIKNITGQPEQATIMEDVDESMESSDIPVCIYNWSQKKQTNSVIAFFIEPILHFNSYGFREILCWDDGRTIYSNSYLLGYLGQWHLSISVVALILSLFSPLLLFMCRRTDTHICSKSMKPTKEEESAARTTLDTTNEYQRMSYDTEPLPFGASYLVLHWDRPIYNRDGKVRLPFFSAFFPCLNIRLVILSFLLQITPNLIRLLAPDYKDTVEYSPVTIYVVSSVTTYVALISAYLVIFTDNIKNTWFAKHDTVLGMCIEAKYEKLWQPNVPDGHHYSENVGMFLQIMSHRVHIFSRKIFRSFLRQPFSCHFSSSKCIFVVMLKFVTKLVAFAVNAMPLVGYFQLAVVIGDNNKITDPKKLFSQICRFFMVLFSLKVIMVINFYIVCFIYTIIFLFAFTKEIGPSVSLVMAILVIVVKPCNNFFNIYCKLFHSVMQAAKTVQEHIHTIDQDSNSLKLLKLVHGGKEYGELLDKVKKEVKKDTLTSLIQYTEDGNPTIESKLFWAMVKKHQPMWWTIVVHVIITYLIPIVSVFALVSAYFWGVNITFADLAERADTSAVIVIATTFTLVWLLFLSKEQSNCWNESLAPKYAYDVLYYALHGKVHWRSHWGGKGGQSATPGSENLPKIRKKLHGKVHWRSHWGGKGGRVPPLAAKICQKSGKIGKKSGKIGEKIRKNREKEENREEKAKIGKFLSLCPS